MVVANTPVNQAAIAPATVTTVKQALASKDNTPVKLHGQVVKSLGDENINSAIRAVALQLM